LYRKRRNELYEVIFMPGYRSRQRGWIFCIAGNVALVVVTRWLDMDQHVGKLGKR
jgi:hypothetical protein